MSYGIPAAGAATPVCPRHPDRVSYVLCQRCGRPTCPDCQRSAAVGIQCVDCINETNRARPAYSTPYGGRVRTGAPIATYVLIAACVLVFAAQLLIPGNAVENALAYAPFTTAAEPWRMVTSAFLHSTGFLLHIAFNMYALWILGRVLEPVLGIGRYLALYLISAFGGSVGVLLIAPVGTEVVGASGAIFGLFGALFVVQRQRGGDVRQIVILLVINAVLGFSVPGIAWQAHLGGLITGGLAAVVLAHSPSGRRRSTYQWGGLALLVVLLGGAAIVRTLAIADVTAQYGW